MELSLTVKSVRCDMSVLGYTELSYVNGDVTVELVAFGANFILDWSGEQPKVGDKFKITIEKL